jgi:MFS family permease
MGTQTGAIGADAGSSQSDATQGHLTGYGTKAYRSYVLNALLFIYILNFLDRGLLGVVSEPIMNEFKITDFWFGLLTGPAFAIFYAIIGIPLARYAERADRVWIMTVCIALWSAATALCGVAADINLGFVAISGFVLLCMFRVLVGVGEAGCTPPANSLIADYYPPKRRSTALGYYAMGVTVGTLAANLIGGPVTEAFRVMFTASEIVARGAADTMTLEICKVAKYSDLAKLPVEQGDICRHGVSMGWRAAFILIGAIGVGLAVIFRLTVKEPPRGYSDPPGATKAQRASFSEALKELGSKRSFWLMAAGATLSSFCGYGIVTFQTSFIVRTHAVSQADVTLLFNVPSAFAASIGVFATGWLAERMVKKSPNAIAWMPAIGLIVAVPFYLVGFSTDDKWLCLVCICAGAMVKYGYLAAQYTIGQGVVGMRTRATATAILLFIINLIGYGLGPLFIGALSDTLFGIHAAGTAGMEELARSSCKGSALNALGEAQKAFCTRADAEALQNSLVITSALYVLPAIFFLLCMKTLQKDLVAK